jgi:hypothetical protein
MSLPAPSDDAPAARAQTTGRPDSGAAGRTTRLVATLVLIPAVPLLLISIGALLLFYAAPERLNSLLAVLPGDEFIRMALFFGPATMFGVVSLAVIYAREGLEAPAAGEAPAAPRPAGETKRPAAPRPWPQTALVPTAVVLLGSLIMWLLSFIAPGRFGMLVDPLPGTSLIRLAVRFGPLVLGAAFAVVLWLSLRAPKAAMAGAGAPAGVRPRRAARAAVMLLLFPAVPMLLISMGALLSYYLTPDLFRKILAHLGSETFLRLVLLLAPAFLFAIIALAGLYLSAPPSGRGAAEPAPIGLQATARESLAIGVLVGGVAATAMIGSAILGVMLYLLLR